MTWTSCWTSHVPELCSGSPPAEERSEREEERWARDYAITNARSPSASAGLRNLAKCALRWDRTIQENL